MNSRTSDPPADHATAAKDKETEPYETRHASQHEQNTYAT
jgi:hypothetical protein